MTFAPISYKIACFDGAVLVHGYAVKMPPSLAHIRLCVRRCHGEWGVDLYDPGYSFGGPAISIWETHKPSLAYAKSWWCDGKSRESAAAWAIRYLRHLKRSRPEHWALLTGG